MAEVDVFQKALFFAALQSTLKEYTDESRKAAIEALPLGEDVKKTHDGVTLGRVSYSAGKDAAVVTDQDAFVAHVVEVAGGAEIQARVKNATDVFELLQQLAPERVDEFIETSFFVPEWRQQELLNAALRGETVPGVEVRPGKPVLRVTPHAEAKARVKDILGTDPLRMLEAVNE